MDFLKPEHKNRAIEFLEKIKQELSRPSEQILQNLRRRKGEDPIAELVKEGLECMSSDVATAAIIWEYVLAQLQTADQATNERVQNTRFDVLHQYFIALVCIGPWKKTLETAKLLLSEVSKLKEMQTQLPGFNEEALLCHLFVAHIDVGTSYRLLKNFSLAREHFNKGLELAGEMNDHDKTLLAKVHFVLCLLDQGQLKQAIDEYLIPMMQYKDSMKPQTRALYLEQFGNACRSAAKWGEARKYLQEALEIARNLKDPQLVSNCCGDLGNVFRSEGRYKFAEDFHMKHIRIARKRGDVYGIAVSYGNLGFLKFYHPEEHDLSVVYQTTEFELAREIGDFGRTGIAMNKIGKLYSALQYNDQAAEMFKFAIQCHRRAHNIAGEGMAWGNLGTVYRALGRYDDAIKCHQNYRINAEKRLDVGGVAIMQTQIAVDYLLINDLALAESEVLRALHTLEAIRRQLGEDDQAKISNFEKNQSEAYNILQVVLLKQRKFKEALVLSEISRARALAELVKEKFEGNESVKQGGDHLKDFMVEQNFIERTFENILTVCRDLNTLLVFYSLIKEPTDGKASTEWIFVWVVHPSGTVNFTKTLFETNIQTKVKFNENMVIDLTRSLNQTSGLENFLSRLKLDEEQTRLRKAVHPVIAKESACDDNKLQLFDYVEEDLFPKPSATKLNVWNDKELVKESTTSHFPLTHNDKSANKSLTKGIESVEKLKTLFPNESQNEKTEKGVQKDHSGTNLQTTVLVHKTPSINVQSTRPPCTETAVIQSNAVPNPEAVQNPHGSQDSTELKDWGTVLTQLNRVLIKPIKRFLPTSATDVSRIVFIPQDFLLKVPFAALHNDESQLYLNNEFAISTCPSIQLLQLTTSRLMQLRNASREEQPSLLAVGNPKMPFDEIPALPAASNEVRKVKEIMALPKSDILVWTRATKKRVMAIMEDYKILHFATHGIVDEENSHGDYSMRGFLVLASSDGKNCNGLLSAEEIRGMRLSAELVVLSCCETGRGKVTGDGVLGLSRAFLVAGAACVVVTLWNIDDKSTSPLMEYFYRDYKMSRDASHALHTAMKKFEEEKSANPRHWAAFSIVGSTGKWEGSSL